MFKVVLPFPDQLSRIFIDVGDVMGWNGCVAGCSCYIGQGLAEVMKVLEDVVELMLEAVCKPWE